MGVNTLWNIFSGSQQETNVYALYNKTLAVDLSIWICENMSIGSKISGPINSRLYLRNLFFRIINFQQNGINLVFILDGDPPQLKYNTIISRNNLLANNTNKKSCTRSHFKALSKKCKTLIELMGIPCLQSKKEAESLCALLDNHQMVDGCISRDGDILLYGAKTVYKDFDLNTSLKDDTLTYYTSQAIREKTNFSRNDLIASSLLLGCDYLPAGVPGIGKEQVVQMVNHLYKEGDGDLLDRVRRWRQDPFYTYLQELETIPKVSHCTVCKHPGTYTLHGKSCRTKCQICTTRDGIKESSAQFHLECYCRWHSVQRVLLHHKLDLAMYKKVNKVVAKDFPIDEIVEEFTKVCDTLPRREDLHWKMPDVEGILDYTFETLGWTPEYTMEKVLPFLASRISQSTKSATTNFKSINRNPFHSFSLARIDKGVVRNGIKCYLTLWPRLEFDNFSTSCMESGFYTVTLRRDFLKQGFPHHLTQFESSLATKNIKKNLTKDKVSGMAKKLQSAALDSRLITDFMKHKGPVDSSIQKQESPRICPRNGRISVGGDDKTRSSKAIHDPDTITSSPGIEYVRLDLEDTVLLEYSPPATRCEEGDFRISELSARLESLTFGQGLKPDLLSQNDDPSTLGPGAMPNGGDRSLILFEESFVADKTSGKHDLGRSEMSSLPLEDVVEIVAFRVHNKSPLPLKERLKAKHNKG